MDKQFPTLHDAIRAGLATVGPIGSPIPDTFLDRTWAIEDAAARELLRCIDCGSVAMRDDCGCIDGSHRFVRSAAR